MQRLNSLYLKKNRKIMKKVKKHIFQTYLIFVTGTTGGACGEKICHVEKLLHMTDCHVEKFSMQQIVMWKQFST